MSECYKERKKDTKDKDGVFYIALWFYKLKYLFPANEWFWISLCGPVKIELNRPGSDFKFYHCLYKLGHVTSMSFIFFTYKMS